MDKMAYVFEILGKIYEHLYILFYDMHRFYIPAQ